MFTINYSIFILLIELDFLILSTAITYVRCLEHGESAGDPHGGEIARCLGLCLQGLAQGCPFFYLKISNFIYPLVEVNNLVFIVLGLFSVYSV